MQAYSEYWERTSDFSNQTVNLRKHLVHATLEDSADRNQQGEMGVTAHEGMAQAPVTSDYFVVLMPLG